jgi:hypothetical protein
MDAEQAMKLRWAVLLAQEGADYIRVEAEAPPDAQVREESCLRSVVHPRAADLEVPRDVVRVPEAVVGAGRRRGASQVTVILFTQVIDDVAAASLRGVMRALAPQHLPLAALFRDGALDTLVDAPEADLYVRGAAAEVVLWRERLAREFEAGGALVLHTLPQRLTPALVDRYLGIKAQQLL